MNKCKNCGYSEDGLMLTCPECGGKDLDFEDTERTPGKAMHMMKANTELVSISGNC